MKPVTTCGVLCSIYGKASVCVPICIEINEVHVACNILFAVSVSLIQLLKNKVERQSLALKINRLRYNASGMQTNSSEVYLRMEKPVISR